jgi:Uma2 family endonuclease
MSPAEYLAWEGGQQQKHQLLDGEVFAIAGGSPRHNRICARLLARLEAALAPPCAAFSSDQKVFIPAFGNFVYPDVTVVSGRIELHELSADVITNPRVVIEVLSKSTEQNDRGDKWQGYRSVRSLTDYLLVSQRVARLEHFTREADGSWRYRVFGAGEQLELTTGALLVVDDLFQGVLDIPGDG